MGTGAAVGGIDLPHSRESATGLPNVPGSGIKGVWRDQFSADNKSRLFGAERHGEESSRNQGALLFSDAWLLCMPVMSYVGDFAWVTSPMSLARFGRERRFVNPQETQLPALPKVALSSACRTEDCVLAHAEHLYLHELKIQAVSCESTNAWAKLVAGEIFQGDASYQQEFVKRFIVVGDAELVHLSHAAAYVPMRNKLGENKQVESGALWSEECMPSESIFWGTVGADSLMKVSAKDSLDQFVELASSIPRLQFGGKASVGRGMCRFVMPQSNAVENQVK